jgi:hypothetical protein
MFNKEIKDLKILIGKNVNSEKSSEKIISYLEKDDVCVQKFKEIGGA